MLREKERGGQVVWSNIRGMRWGIEFGNGNLEKRGGRGEGNKQGERR